QNLFGVGSDRGGFQAFSTSRLQLIQHNFAKGRPSGAPAFLARAKFLTFAFFERVPNAERQHIIEAQRTVGRLLHRLFWPRPFRNCAHPPHFFQKRGLPNVFPDGKQSLPQARDPPRHIRVARDRPSVHKRRSPASGGTSAGAQQRAGPATLQYGRSPSGRSHPSSSQPRRRPKNVNRTGFSRSSTE